MFIGQIIGLYQLLSGPLLRVENSCELVRYCLPFESILWRDMCCTGSTARPLGSHLAAVVTRDTDTSQRSPLPRTSPRDRLILLLEPTTLDL